MAMLNGLDSKCMAVITGREIKDEAAEPTYSMVAAAHESRRRWTGHVIRMGETRMPRQATKAVFEEQKDAEGTLIGDLGWEGAWEGLESAAEDRREWRKESKLMREKREEEWKTRRGARSRAGGKGSPG